MLYKLIFIIFCFGIYQSSAQIAISLGSDSIPVSRTNDMISTMNELQEYISRQREQGYLTASIDTYYIYENKIHYRYERGERYEWAKVEIDSQARRLADRAEISYLFKEKIPLTPKVISAAYIKAISYCEQNGYPFASIGLKDVKIEQNGVTGILDWSLGPLIKIDSIDISGDVAISKHYIEQIIGIHEGDLYNEKLINNISRKIAQLSFAEEAKRWRISYSSSKTILNIYLKSRNANRADILVGILPNTSTIPGLSNSVLLTGDIKLQLVNELNYGEQISMQWQNLQYRSPRVNLESHLPYIAKTSIGIGGKFNYIKQDSSFTNVTGTAYIQHQLQAQQYIKLYYHSNNNRLITVDTSYVIAFRSLPAQADISNRGLGTELYLSNLDYSLAPRSGMSAMINGSVGRRSLIRNSVIEQLWDFTRGSSFAYLYDSMDAISYNISVTSFLQGYVPITKSFVSRFYYQGGKVYNRNLFKNELFQIGGYKTLRGFNEASLFVRDYHIMTIEPRYYISRNSFLHLITDAGVVRPQDKFLFASGLGAGLTLDLKAGMFNILYAVGNNLENNFGIRDAKIHFGYINRF